MRTTRMGLIAAIVATVASLGPPAGATIVGLPAWDVVQTRNPGAGENQFNGVTAIAAADVWAVGSTSGRTLTEHWDGSRFSIVESPNVPNRSNVLEDADATATDDVWGVGHADVPDFVGSRSLIIHWDGSSWKLVPSPSMGSGTDENDLFGVAAITPDDAWAVGTFIDRDISRGRGLTLHWDGQDWTSVPNRCGVTLRDVFAVSSDNVWAVGGASTCHWNGTKWLPQRIAPAPNGSYSIDLFDVSGTGPSNLWAVGFVASSCGEGQLCYSGAIEHWNGSTWSFPSSVGQVLYSVHAISASDVYAVGIGMGASIIHFDGSGWESLPGPTPTVIGQLSAVDATSADDLWAAGLRYTQGPIATLVEHASSPTSGAVVGDTNVSGGTVSWFGPESGSVETDQFGEYRVGGLTAGAYTFTATLSGCTPASKRVVVPAGTTIGVNFRLGC